MQILCIGDSNFRDLFSAKKSEIEAGSGCKITFSLGTSVGSIKTILENIEGNPRVVFIGSPTNEISLKSRNNTKSREGIIEAVITDFYNQLNNVATKNESTMFVVCQPFARYETPWLEAKFNIYLDYVKTTHNNTSLNNVHLGSEISITLEDLKPDKIHLNGEGLSKLAKVLTTDIKTAASSVDGRESRQSVTSLDESMDEDLPISQGRSLRKTPARKKRPLEESDEDGKSKKKKSKDRIDSVLEKLDLLVDKLNCDKESNRGRFDRIEDKLAETILQQEIIKEQVEVLKKGDTSFTAAIREDLDAVENSNSRDTVIIKKLAFNDEIPTDKKELSSLIVKVGREILQLVMGDDKGMKYIAPLFFNNNRRIPKEGARKELPPFRITFKHLADAIEFKEKCITFSKDPSHRLHKSYISNQQTIGTRIRLSLLWSIAESLKKEGKDSWVTQSSMKPTLMVKETGNLVRTYSYIDSVMTYGEKIDKKAKEEATKLASRFFYGQIEKIFVVLKD